MCVAIASAAALPTPVATAATTTGAGPGGHRFGDYRRVGAPILLPCLAVTVAVAVVPPAWSL